MRLSNKAIEILIGEIAGKETISLVLLIRNKEHVSEFKIADKLDISVNQVRNMLYRLVNYNMVSFIRKKDKKKGWYIYYWTFKEDRALEIFDRILQLKIDKLSNLLEKEQHEQYYSCPDKCLRFNLTEAMEVDFKCPECGQIMHLEDNRLRISKIKKRLEELSNKEEFYVKERIRRKPRKKKKKVKKKRKKKKVKKRIKKKRKPKKKRKKKRVKRKKKKPKKKIKKRPKRRKVKKKRIKKKKPKKKKKRKRVSKRITKKRKPRKKKRR